MFVRQAWYVAAFSHECTHQPLGRTLLGEPVVLFRTPSGPCVALQDRCCHRFAPLSMGDVETDGIRCRYHGMKFNPLGQCIDIPGQTQIPPKMAVRSFPLVEQHGLIWIWLGDPQSADPAEIIDVHWNDDPSWPTARGYIHYKANYQLITDNLLDFSHLTFVHRSTLANAAFPNAHPQITSFDRGIRLTREIRDCTASPLHAMAGRFDGPVDFWNRQVWWLPSVFENWAGSVPAGGQGAPHERPGGLHLRHFSLLTPETEKTTHYFWVQPCQFPHGDAGVIEQVGQGIAKAFAEDNEIIEAQQKAWDACPPGTQPMAVRNDAALGGVRFMIDQLLQQERLATAVPSTL